MASRWPSMLLLALVACDSDDLTDITALHDIESISGSLTITANPSLPTSAAEALVEAIGKQSIAGEITTSGNGEGR